MQKWTGSNAAALVHALLHSWFSLARVFMELPILRESFGLLYLCLVELMEN